MLPTELIKGYWHYWLHAVNEHALQAPFVYQLYGSVIKPDWQDPSFEQIEATRRTFLQSRERVPARDWGAKSRVSSQPERTIRSIARHSLSSPKFSRLLYRLATYQSANNIVELGTSLGINTLYLSAVTAARVYTLEGNPSLADRAEQAFRRAERTNIDLIRGNIDETLPDLIKKLPKVDVAYVDANHRFEPTVRYFEQLTQKTHPDSVIVIDDIYWSGEMRQAWQHIKQHPSVTLSIDLFDAGLVFFLPLKVRQDYTLLF